MTFQVAASETPYVAVWTIFLSLDLLFFDMVGG